MPTSRIAGTSLPAARAQVIPITARAASPIVSASPAPTHAPPAPPATPLPHVEPLPAPPKNAKHALTGYYLSRDTIYGPERSGEFYVHGERIYLSRRALGARADIPGAAARELGRVLGDLAGMPRPSGTVANRVPDRDLPPIPTGYFTINGRIYGGLGRASDPIAGVQRAGDAAATTSEGRQSASARLGPTAARGNVSAQLAKGEFRIIGNLVYGPPGRRVPWLTAIPRAPRNSAAPVTAARSDAAPAPAGESTKCRPGSAPPRATKKKRRKKARRPVVQAIAS